MGEAIWTLEGVSVGGADRDRLQQVDLQIVEGVTAVIGASGAGKTSLLNLLVDFEKPDVGDVRFKPSRNGVATSRFWAPPQGGLWPHLTAIEHLLCAMASSDRREAQKQLASFDLEPLVDQRPDRMSEGERARLSVARALATCASVIVLDEPLVHVDPSRMDLYWQHVLSTAKQQQTSIVFSTHTPGFVVGGADRAVCLEEGRIAYEGSVERLYHAPPSASLARCLGPVNWFTPEEANIWLKESSVTTGESRCLRPEQIELVDDSQSPLVVQSCRFEGAVCQTELTHTVARTDRSITHRTSAKRPAIGSRVAIRILALLMAVGVLGCEAKEDPSLEFSEVRHLFLAPEGTQMPSPRGLTVNKEGQLVVLDTIGRVLVQDIDGKVIRQWKMPETSVGRPEGIMQLKDGRYVVADTHYHRVVFFDVAGKVTQMFGERGDGPGQFQYPVHLDQDPDGNLYVAEYGGNDRVQKFTLDGKWILSFGQFGTEPGQFGRLSGIAWHDGKIYAADAVTHRVQVFTDDGKFISILGGADPPALRFPYDLAFGSNDLLYVVEFGAGRLTALDPATGAVVGRFGRNGNGKGQMSTPWGVAIDPKGPLWVADTGNRRLLRLSQASP
jgi:iron(III) transport system ATP-binding protein